MATSYQKRLIFGALSENFRMKIVFDARPMASQFSGLGRYTGSLLSALLDSYTNSSIEVIALLDSKHHWDDNLHFSSLTGYLKSGGCSVVYVDAPSISLKQHFTVSKAVKRIKPDYYFYPHFDLPFGIEANTTFVIHDLIPLIVPGYVQSYAWAKRLYFKQMIKHGVMNAARCVAVSETTRKDVLDVVGDRFANKVDVVYEGSVLGSSNDVGHHKPVIGVDMPYLLYVGDRRPHKNLPRIVDLFIKLKDFHDYPGQLVLAGSKQNYGFDLDKYIEGRSDIKVLSNVSDNQLIDLYRSTDALIFLSEYEGFGLPVVEAARFGRKMILSDGGSLPEIAPEDACILERYLSLEEAANRAASYLAQNTLPSYMDYNDRFSWEKSARAIFPYAYNWKQN
jgi:glycosyltransferase involved in cell wall biosynthesis